MSLSDKVRSVLSRGKGRGELDIVFVLFNADGMGGTSRSAIAQANALVAMGEGHRVRLLSVTQTADAVYYPLAPEVKVTHLVDMRGEKPRAVRGDHPSQLAERRSRLVPSTWDHTFNALTDETLQDAVSRLKADVVVTTTPELLAVVAQLAPPKVAIVHQEHRASSQRIRDKEALLQFAPRADVVVSLTQSMSLWLSQNLGGAAPELRVMPNPLPGVQERSPLDQKTFTTAGRLVPEKQFGHIIRAFDEIKDEVPGWTLTIWGGGPFRRTLQAQVRKLGLQDRVKVPGTTQDIAAEWARTSVCVLASRQEGYPLVLQEAMSAGVPSISYDCPAGPREIITHEVDGLLAIPDSKSSLAAAMLRLATDDNLRHTMGAAALERSREWDAATLAAQWVDIFRSAVRRRHDPLAPRRVVHTPGPSYLDGLPEGDSAAGITPSEAITTVLDVATTAARATGDDWFVIPQHGLDLYPVLAIPASKRREFLTALAEGDFPDWIALRDPAEHGWHSRRGTLKNMGQELLHAQTATLYLEPFPHRGGHKGLLRGDNMQVAVEFWQDRHDGSLSAPAFNRYGDTVPADSERVTMTVHDVEVPTMEIMTVPTWDDCNFEVDVVYTWVDGDDPEWQDARDERIRGLGQDPHPRSSGDVRYRSRDELRYSMRSVHAFAPWVRRIHLVTAGQVPDWLDTSHPKIRLVPHSEILPAEVLPTFSSHAIEARLHHVPDLTEHFIYMNDDVFLGRPRRPANFFSPTGLFLSFLAEQRVVGLPGTDDRPYLTAAQNNRRLLREALGVMATATMMHSPHPHRRSVLEEICARFPEAIEATLHNPFRAETDVSMLSSLAQNYGLATGQSLHRKARNGYLDLAHPQLDFFLERWLAERSRDFFCLADANVAAEDEERVHGELTQFLTSYFPVAAPWEK